MARALREPGEACRRLAADAARAFLPSLQAALNQHLLNDVRKTVQGRVKLGVQAFAEAVMVVPKTLAENSGFETQDVTIALQEEVERGNVAGLDIDTGEPCDPAVAGIYDNYIVKVQILNSACVGPGRRSPPRARLRPLRSSRWGSQRTRLTHAPASALCFPPPLLQAGYRFAAAACG